MLMTETPHKMSTRVDILSMSLKAAVCLPNMYCTSPTCLPLGPPDHRRDCETGNKGQVL
jgi:hypothetical protein